MPQTQLQVFVNGKEFSQHELAKMYIDRSYSALHEMKQLGATLLDEQGQVINESEIEYLPQAKVPCLLLDNKLRIGKRELNRLYEEQYRLSDAMWSDILALSNGEYSQKVARAHLIVTGLTFGKYMKIIGSTLKIKKFLLSMHPDHIDAFLTSVTETMGIYGKPTQMKGKLQKEAPGPVSSDHNLRLIGASYLTADPTKRNAIAMHQVKRFKGGLDILAGAYLW